MNTYKVTHRFSLIIYLLLLGYCHLGMGVDCLAQTSVIPNSLLDNEEGDLKLTIPEGQEKAVWQYLNETLNSVTLQNIDSSLLMKKGEENVVDTYYDNNTQSLLRQWASVRHRAIYKRDTLFKEYTLLKSSGYVQQAVKQKLAAYAPKEPKDTKQNHTFWQHIRPNDRRKVDAFLSPMNTTGNLLRPILKVNQKRHRIFVSENNQRILTVTLDTIESAIFPYACFAEIEIELTPYAPSKPWLRPNSSPAKVAYEGANIGKAANFTLKDFLAQKLRSELGIRFPDLVENTTPKYNKLTEMLHKNWIAKVYAYIIPILVGSLFVGVVYHLFKI